MNARSALLILPLVSALAACNPCAEACRAESAAYEDCLAEWGLEWADLGAEDRPGFRQECVIDVNLHDASLEPDSRATERKLCGSLVSDLRAASTCDESWQALVDYGREP